MRCQSLYKISPIRVACSPFTCVAPLKYIPCGDSQTFTAWTMAAPFGVRRRIQGVPVSLT